MTNERAVERIVQTAASPEGANSTYVLPERGVVIDPGPPGDEPWDVLTTGLADAGLATDDVETVIVTHWHVDHAGLAPRLADAADATLALHETDAPLVADYASARDRRIEQDTRRLREWGIPPSLVETLRENDTPSPMPDECAVTTITDGETLAGLEVIHAPGHTAGHLVLDDGDALYLGDAVLPMYTPNVGGTDTRLSRALESYLESLDRIADRSAPETCAYPGHGARVDLIDRIEEIRAHHAERVRAAVAELPERGSEGATVWAVARALFGEMAGIHAKMGAGEAATHLAFAANHGLAERTASAPERYVRTSDRPDGVLSRYR